MYVDFVWRDCNNYIYTTRIPVCKSNTDECRRKGSILFLVECRISVLSVYFGNVMEALWRQLDRERVDVFLQLVHGSGTDDGGCHKPARMTPCQGKLGGRQIVPLRNVAIFGDSLTSNALLIPLHVSTDMRNIHE